jgi:hypothetical protein
MFDNLRFSIGTVGDTTYTGIVIEDDGFIVEYDFVFQDEPEARDFFGEVYWARVTAYAKPTFAVPNPEYAEVTHSIGARS